jgi:hypothetical protein
MEMPTEKAVIFIENFLGAGATFPNVRIHAQFERHNKSNPTAHIQSVGRSFGYSDQYIDENGNRIHYFKRILINYKDSNGARVETSFDEIRDELDRLDGDEVVCYFHIDHKMSKLSSITVITNKSKEVSVRALMEEAGFTLSHKDTYSRTVFSSFTPTRSMTEDEINKLFVAVKKVVNAEVLHKSQA